MIKGRDVYHRGLYEHWKFNHGGICPHCHKPIETFNEEMLVKSEHLTGGCLPIIIAS